MDGTLIWVGAGIALIILELVTGTFYLLVLGAAALAGGLLHWLGQPLWAQAAAAVICGVAGVVLVQRQRLGAPAAGGDPGLDQGQPVTFERWVSREGGLARVIYRGAQWDARVEGEAQPGDVLYIRSQSGNTLNVARTPA